MSLVMPRARPLPTAAGQVRLVRSMRLLFTRFPGYGTRLLTAGAITGMQVVKTPGYLAIAGVRIPLAGDRSLEADRLTVLQRHDRRRASWRRWRRA
jgi:hypothetical protein